MVHPVVYFFALATVLICVAASGQSLNIDLGYQGGAPDPSYGGPFGQPGTWNEIAAASASNLLDLAGTATTVDLEVVGADSLDGAWGCSTADAELVSDSIYASVSAEWRVVLSGLLNDSYEVALYAHANPAAPTGPMSVDGSPVPELVGAGTCVPVEGASWISVVTTVTDGTLTIVGTRTGSYAGLAGIQIRLVSQRLNLDIGGAGGAPDPTYGGPIGQPGVWNSITATSASNLLDIYGVATGIGVDFVGADSLTGAWGCSTADAGLVSDSFFASVSTEWRVVLSGLHNGTFSVALYAHSNPAAPTGPMVANGVSVPELVGAGDCSPVEGKSWATVVTDVVDGTLTIVGTRTGSYAGLAGVQLTQSSVPVELQSFTIE